jgi:hypothetical protein
VSTLVIARQAGSYRQSTRLSRDDSSKYFGLLIRLKQLEIKMAAPGYDENVSDDIKSTNKERFDAMKKKIADIEEAITNFTNLAALE